MNKFNFGVKLVLLGSIISLTACVEPFDAETLTFESALVINATISNEMKQQEIRLSRTFAFEEDGPEAERNADVRVVDDLGIEYSFTEGSPGVYSSESAFSAVADRSYQLMITSSDGRSYTSDPTRLTPIAVLDEVFAERITNKDGVEGMAIRVNGSSPSGNARNYRYVFEETYKVIAPKWNPRDLAPDPDERCGVLVVLRENEEQTCYATQPSNSIILTDTNDFEEDRVNDFMVRFINRDNYIITHRYSILVHQLVQSPEAYSYFETLNDFSDSESLFSETQPGFLQGNVYSSDNPDEKVLGYFDVASVSQKRIFFNYEDFFPNEPLPPYINKCLETAPPIYGKVSGPVPEEFLRCVLKPLVELDSIRYVDENDDSIGEGGPYIVVPRECGDCTALGSNQIPEFWTEE
jgi:hypothetical protein